MTRRIYIPLPDAEARKYILEAKLSKVNGSIDEAGKEEIVKMTDSYSCADM